MYAEVQICQVRLIGPLYKGAGVHPRGDIGNELHRDLTGNEPVRGQGNVIIGGFRRQCEMLVQLKGTGGFIPDAGAVIEIPLPSS